ncbi:crotonase/enoyl-CoA hydratase family protein [Thermoleophilia bacterium SCSIO 60948]|nr:crotonase/enoyl-CoA hydratase family protein [Thermoleophilia bacterium SCSIO 60948]
MSAEVSYERERAVAVVSIDRPDRRNAVAPSTAAALRQARDRFEADEDARVLVLTGAGGTFCAGADLKALGSELDPERALAWSESPEGPLGFTRTDPSKPAIAAIEGWCVAGGLELALWCDLRIAARGARFGCTERRFGVPLIDGGTQRLPRVVGQGRALEMVLTGRIVEAEEALGWGLANEVVDDGSALERAVELGERIASFPQPTMLSDRRALLEGTGRPLSEGLELEARLGAEVLGEAARGAGRFAAGEGRGASGV